MSIDAQTIYCFSKNGAMARSCRQMLAGVLKHYWSKQAFCTQRHKKSLNATCICMLLYDYTCTLPMANIYICWIYSCKVIYAQV